MKKIILIILISIMASSSYAEEGAIFGLGYNHMKMGKESVNMYGINMEIFVSDALSINYSLFLGFNSDNFYAHTNAGIAIGLDLIAYDLYDDEDEENSLADGIRALGIICLLIPEGINYHIPLEGNEIELVPYLHPLGYDYVDGNYSVSSGIGLRLQYNMPSSICISPYMGIRYAYNLNHGITDAGVMVQYKL